MNILTLIRAVPGVGPYVPYIMMLPLGLGACSGAGSNPAADIAALESGLTAAESAATAYITLPLCAPAPATAGGNNAPLCSKASITAQIKTADAQAYALVKAAETSTCRWRSNIGEKRLPGHPPSPALSRTSCPRATRNLINADRAYYCPDSASASRWASPYVAAGVAAAPETACVAH